MKDEEFQIMMEALSKEIDESSLDQDEIKELREKELKQAWMKRVEAYLIIYPQYIDEKELGYVLLIKYINNSL